MNTKNILSRAENFKKANRRRGDIGYIVIHYTGNRGDTASGNGAYFSRERVGTSAHYFVDESNVVCSVQEKDVAWHCGAKTGYYHPSCRNSNSIGVEICMNSKSGSIRQRSIDNAALLVKVLMQKYNIPASNVVRHYDVTHKSCPEPMVANPTLWSNFKAALKNTSIKKEDDDVYTIYKTIKDVPDWARECVNDLIKRGYLKGDGDGSLDLEHYMLRGMVINWRAGLYK